ncbi:MAG: VacJ family lipoprotein [Proteobacteria bacterium]|nr:VacJ family lipoprotein [Pseudomonadota bacterium]
MLFYRYAFVFLFDLIACFSFGSVSEAAEANQSPPSVHNSAATVTTQVNAKTAQPDNDINDTETELPAAPPMQNVDPYEKFNRAMFTFNDYLDRWILRPVAVGYDKVTPTPIHKGITNFFDNLDTLTTIPNDLLQGKTAYFTADTWRFIINSTLGIGGLFDIATRFGLPKHHEDFGLTLAYWSGSNGLKPQPYLVLPFLGSTTTRDAFGKIPDAATWPFNYIYPQYYSLGIEGIYYVNLRASLLPADKLVKEAFDPYIFVRSAYLQSRNHQIEKSSHETNFPPYTTEKETPLNPDEAAGNEL